MIKAVLLDFDGTLVTEDVLSVITKVVGKKAESEKLNEDFHKGISQGLTGLIARINLLTDITLDQINEILSGNDYLMPGAIELINYLHKQGIVIIVASGNILPVLEHYKKKLEIEYIIGSNPKVRDGKLAGISEADFPSSDYKLTESQKILEQLGITAEEVLAIGDSPGDKSRFLFAKYSIAINPKEGIDQLATHVIRDDLSLAIPLIESLSR